MQHLLTTRMFLGYVAVIVATVIGGFLGAVLGIWAAVVWDAAVIGAVLFWLRQRAIARWKGLSR